MNLRNPPNRWQRKATRVRRALDFAIDSARLTASRVRARLFGRATSMPAPSRVVSSSIAAPESEADHPVFRAEVAPLVSIVVPVYNQLEHSMRCLRSLAQVGATHAFEVIVVDDGSSDGSAEWLGQCGGLRLHRMPQNSGFIHACNAGAVLARGRYLVFLNNDTELRPGWLDALIGTFGLVPDCGLVGAKLVYPDGSLQEAGGIVFADGNACNYGRGGDPDDPRYDFLREADYCSGACIALPTELFHALGGFDARYAPAYYEDTDLAFSVRAAGQAVIYQPRAEVVHFEGRTAGTDTANGVKRFQQINREKFVAKQQQELSNQPASGDFAVSPERCATHRRTCHVLVMDADYPHPDRDSGSLRMFNILMLLRELGCHVLFWADGMKDRDADARMLEQQGIEIVGPASREQALQWWHRRGDQIDIVWLSRLPVALKAIQFARRYATQARVIFDTVDLHFLRIARGAALHGNSGDAQWAEQLRKQELGLMRKAEMTLVVSEFEKKLLGEMTPTADVRVLSNIHPVYGRNSAFVETSGLLFLGNFEHAPNIDAARWLIEEVMPRLHEKLPHARLHVVGYAGEQALAGYASDEVLVHGHVADIEPILRSVRLALAPLRFGAGVKGKINMAMSYGVPVVTTSIGAEGMDLVHRRDVLIADDADAFAEAIRELHGDESLWSSLSEQGLAHVDRHFSVEVARSALRDILAGTTASKARKSLNH
ncbi:MAG: glycosyltransferase [Rhodanobacter sp.]